MNQKKHRGSIFGWAVFDVANSSYTTIIITVAFNVIFSQIIVAQGDPNLFAKGNTLWSWVLSVSWGIAALLGPLLGALSDVSGNKKKWLFFSVVLCSVSTGLLYFAEPGALWLTAGLIVISNLGFSLSENFISAFLPHLVPAEKMGRVSGLGWGLGYLGGLGSIVLVSFLVGMDFSIGEFEQLRWVGPLTGLFFIFFSLPTFLLVPEPVVSNSLQAVGIRAAYLELFKTLKEIRKYRALAIFFASFFFFQAGLSIVISFAALYGQQEIKLSATLFSVFFLVLQLSAGFGAVVFGYIQDKKGPIWALNLTLYIWISTILAIYFVKDLSLLAGIRVDFLFIAISNFAGLCLGATQASARTIVGLLSPKNLSGQVYGFWGFFGKWAAVAGVLAFGGLQEIFDLRQAMLACCSFFVVGLLLNQGTRRALKDTPHQ